MLCGLDINNYGVQLAACNLTLGAPDIDYDKMNLHTMPHGPQPDKTVSAGSLEILRTESGQKTMQDFVQPLRNIGDLNAEQVNKITLDYPLAELDMVIMNPPFSSNISRASKFTDEDRKKMQEHELAIKAELEYRDKDAGKLVDANSIGTFFSPLADRLVDKRDGTLAMINPVTACINSMALENRKFLAKRFHVECVITNQDVKRSFSYATSINECMIICKRHSGAKPPTRFISLLKMPNGIKEARELIEKIKKKEIVGCQWPADLVSGGDWTPAQWHDDKIPHIIRKLEQSTRLQPIGERFEIGPAGRAIRGTFERREDCNKDKCANGVEIFDSISIKIRRSMHGSPDKHWHPKPNKKDLAAKYMKKGNRLLVAAMARTTNCRVTAVYADKPTVGNGWVPVSAKDERTAKALAAWWNSTPCIMMLLNRRGKTLTYPRWSIDHLRTVCIPKPDNPNWNTLYDAYEKTADVELLPWSKSDKDAARQMIDDAAAQVLDIDPTVMEKWRKILRDEPSIKRS